MKHFRILWLQYLSSTKRLALHAFSLACLLHCSLILPKGALKSCSSALPAGCLVGKSGSSWKGLRFPHRLKNYNRKNLHLRFIPLICITWPRLKVSYTTHYYTYQHRLLSLNNPLTSKFVIFFFPLCRLQNFHLYIYIEYKSMSKTNLFI